MKILSRHCRERKKRRKKCLRVSNFTLLVFLKWHHGSEGVNVLLIVRDKVTRQCPQTTTFEEKREPKRIWTEVSLITSQTARPNQLTAFFLFYDTVISRNEINKVFCIAKICWPANAVNVCPHVTKLMFKTIALPLFWFTVKVQEVSMREIFVGVRHRLDHPRFLWLSVGITM